ncbi:TPA: hypothetical protein N0F65_006237 [Lagenidium giganteum]|uniref:BZIP domain-containing protein n=1 Tax=Lagenidium giganteum TaxID=4803 RepID=A0AAV2Z3W5_9STRA|nr:TPA: hypothetical protein N0F65_006237 [Lagenidium giganteum]
MSANGGWAPNDQDHEFLFAQEMATMLPTTSLMFNMSDLMEQAPRIMSPPMQFSVQPASDLNALDATFDELDMMFLTQPCSLTSDDGNSSDSRTTTPSPYSSPASNDTSRAGDSSPEASSPSTPMSNSAEPADPQERRRQRMAMHARAKRSRKKNEMTTLREQVTHLTSHLELLRARHQQLRQSSSLAAWEEKAMAQRCKRRQAELLNAQLRQALMVQDGFVFDLKTCFSSAPVFSREMKVRELLHTYTHLGTNAAARRRDYESICTNAKLDMALELVRQETLPIRVLAPHLSTSNWSGRGQFGSTHKVVYSFKEKDVSKVFEAAVCALRGAGSPWPEYDQVVANAETIDAPADNIYYGAATAHYKRKHPTAGAMDSVIVESRSIVYYRMTESHGIVVWDYVDVDDLFPMSIESHVVRQVVGILFVSREMCDDGVQRLVCRMICDKVHTVNIPTAASQQFSCTKDDARRSCSSALYSFLDSVVNSPDHVEMPDMCHTTNANMKFSRLRDGAEAWQIALTTREPGLSALEIALKRTTLLQLRSRLPMHGSSGLWQEQALMERHKLARAQQDNQRLREAVFQHHGVTQVLQSAFSSAPVFDKTLQLIELFHSFTHLGKRPARRREWLTGLRTRAKLDMAAQMLRRETQHIDPTSPFISTQNWTRSNCFGSIQRGVYAFDNADVGPIFDTACKELFLVSSTWPRYREVDSQTQVIDQLDDDVMYQQTVVRYQYAPAHSGRNHDDHDDQNEVLVVDVPGVFVVRLSNTYGLVLRDFVDVDDLFPVSTVSNIRREMVGILLVCLEQCDDGVQRVVCRMICNKRHVHLGEHPSRESVRFQATKDDRDLGCAMALFTRLRRAVLEQSGARDQPQNH